MQNKNKTRSLILPALTALIIGLSACSGASDKNTDPATTIPAELQDSEAVDSHNPALKQLESIIDTTQATK